MPEPVLLSIAAALTTKAVQSLYELVVAKFSGDPVATAALEAAGEAAEDSAEVTELNEALERATSQDPEFDKQLRDEWERTSTTVTQAGRTTNHISGTVTGKTLPAGDIYGGVTF